MLLQNEALVESMLTHGEITFRSHLICIMETATKEMKGSHCDSLQEAL